MTKIQDHKRNRSFRRLRAAAGAGSLRPGVRARFLRRRLHRRPQGPQVASDRLRRAQDPRQPRAPRRRGRRPAGRRRRRRAHSDPARLPQGRVQEARLHAAPARPLRRRPHLHAARRASARPLRARVDARRQGRGSGAARLALRAGRQLVAVGDGEGHRAGAPPGVHRAPVEHPRPGRFRARPVPDAQDRLQLDPAGLQGPRHRPLHGVAVEPHARLQGHVPVVPGEGLLHGPVRPAAGLGDGARAPALLDQHLPVVEAGASLSLRRPQRRDQHAARQRQLDGGAPGVGVVAAVRQRHLQAVADLLRGAVGHRLLRQRARVSRHGRLLADPRGDDAHPRGVGRQSADGSQAPRLLRVSRLSHGAVGRPGRHVLLRRPPDRRHARPQRPASGPLFRHQGRPRRHVLGSRRAAGSGRDDRPEVAPAAGQDAAHRPGEGPHRLRRGAEGGDRRQQPVRDVAEADADPRLRPAAAEEGRRRRSRTSACSICSRPSATRRKA